MLYLFNIKNKKFLGFIYENKIITNFFFNKLGTQQFFPVHNTILVVGKFSNYQRHSAAGAC